MRKVRCLLSALVLAASITTAAMAGDIQTPTRSVPADPPAAAKLGDIQTPTLVIIELLLAAIF